MRFYIKFSVLFLIILTSCKSRINTENHYAFDNEGILISEYDVFRKGNIDSVNFYIEASGSMNGFFRKNKATEFKKDVWAVISDFPKIDEVFLFKNMNKKPSGVKLRDFRMQMNAGQLTSSNTTDVPTMLKVIIDDLDEGLCNAAILISDLKYSPPGAASQAVLLDQYQTEIRNLFRGRNYGISIVAAKSEFVDASGNVRCSRSPYYYFIIGESRLVPELNKKIKSNLLAEDTYIGEYISNVDYKTPVYSALPFKNVRNMQNISKADRCYSFSDYSENSEGATFWITANIKHLPVTLDDENSLKEIVNIKSLYGSVISIEEVAGALEMGLNDKRIAEAIEGDVFIKLRVNNVMMNSDVLEVTFKNKPLDLSWCDEFINTTEENDCSGTYSLKELLKGLESGTKHYPFQEKPFFILLSKSKM